MSLLRNKYLNAHTFNLNDPQNMGVNKFHLQLTHDSILDDELAKKLVASWYEKGNNYDYLVEKGNNDAGKFIAQHRMFITMFLDLHFPNTTHLDFPIFFMPTFST